MTDLPTKEEFYRAQKVARAADADAFAAMAKEMRTFFQLRPIDISDQRKAGSSKHADVVEGRFYLAAVNGMWLLGHCVSVWFGYLFRAGSDSYQLDSLDMLFETDLPEIPARIVEWPTRPRRFADDWCSCCHQTWVRDENHEGCYDDDL